MASLFLFKRTHTQIANTQHILCIPFSPCLPPPLCRLHAQHHHPHTPIH
jgi:hypothetical protein